MINGYFFFFFFLVCYINWDLQHAAHAMDKRFLNAYLESVGVPNFRRGANFAAAGSTILPPTQYAFCPFSFGNQVAQFFSFKARVLQLLGNSLCPCYKEI